MRLALTATLSLPLLLTGCALTNTATPGTSAGASLKGNVHGGQQPVVGVHAYLFAANTTGYGQPSVSLLHANTDGTDSLGGYLVSDVNGGFSITSDYACTSGSQVYPLAIGGNPGLPVPQTNPNLALMTNLGQCPASGSFAANIPTVAINEVTTIASVYAISGFMTDLTHVSSSGTPLAQTDIANAFAATNNLVDITTGTALATTPAGNGVAPQLTVNTLANIIATCVNSTGASSTGCSTLFSTALNGTTQPTDTVTAALNIAHSPGVGVVTLLALIPAAPPFAMAHRFLNSNFMIYVEFSGGGVSQALAVLDYDQIAVDAVGNVWKTNFNNGLSELSNLGVPISPSTGYFPAGAHPGSTIGKHLAIDLAGNVWVTLAGAITQLDGSTGVPIGLGVQIPGNIDMFAVDGFDNLWALGEIPSGNVVVKIDNSTHNTTTFSITPSSYSLRLAIDGNNNLWAMTSYGALSEIDGSSGALLSPTNGYTSNQSSTSDMAIDGNGNLWIADDIDSTISKMSSTGNVLFTETANNLLYPAGIAVDGAGTIWVSTLPTKLLIHLDGATGAVIPTPTSHYQGDGFASPLSIALDGSGNIWATNISDPSIIEYIGASTPVVTPIAAGVANHSLGTRP